MANIANLITKDGYEWKFSTVGGVTRVNIETGKEEPYSIKHALSGDTLMRAGILIDKTWGDFKGMLLHIVEV